MKTLESFVQEIVSDQAVKAPLFAIAYEDEINGRRGRIRHEVSSIIYSEFDGRLSRHLHATRGVAFPAVEVVTSFTAEGGPAGGLRSVGAAPTLLDALARIGEAASRRANRGEGTCTLEFDPAPGEDGRAARRAEIDADRLEAIRLARKALDTLGDPALCRVTGDLDGVTVFLPGAEEDVLFEVDFGRATISFPGLCGHGDAPIRAPLLALENELRDNAALSGRMRMVRDMTLRARKEAVDGFCRMAEREVSEFDRSIRDRRLTGFRREIAMDLVDRLTVAFGEGLRGLSPHARLLAFDWAYGAPDEDGEEPRRRITDDRPIAAE